MPQYFDTEMSRPGRSRWATRLVLGAALLALPAATPASAQSDFETQGTRAQGMGGAFTAVADDASATWWNPAGLASVPVVDASVDGGPVTLRGDDTRPVGGAGFWDATRTSVAVALPMLGFSYNHHLISEIRPTSTGGSTANRQDPAAVGRLVRTDRLDVSLDQSLGDFLVIGTTLGVVRGETASVGLPAGVSVADALEAVRGLSGSGQTGIDAHVGAMAFAGPFRIGLVARNLAAPRFDDPAGGQVRLERQVRIGVAYGGGAPAYQRRPWVVDVDADLTQVDAADGPRRGVSAGAERWWAKRRIAVRGGARLQTLGATRPQVSAGASVALRAGVFVEAQVSGGADRAAQGWSLAGRVTF